MYFSLTHFDYADEFDYPMYVMFKDKALINLFKDTLDKCQVDLNEEYPIGFGTNEEIDMTFNTIIDWLEGAKELTADEEAVLERMGVFAHVYNVTDNFRDILYWMICDDLNDEDAAEEFTEQWKALVGN